MADIPSPPPLLLLPGTLCDASVFSPLLERLEGRPAQAVALRGNSAAEAAASILAEAPHRFIACGFSLGGIVALELAAQAPERVAGLILIGATPRPADPDSFERRRALVAQAREAGPASVLSDHLWPNSVARSRQSDHALRSIVAGMADAVGVEAFHDQTEIAIHRADSRPRLSELTLPILALAGAEDTLCPADCLADYETAPRAEIHAIEGAGHFTLVESPGASAAPIKTWLDQHFPLSKARGPTMTSDSPAAKARKTTQLSSSGEEAVLQVERRDFVDLVPEKRERVQSMRGFDECYTDIVDYIVRCTHKIWDERDVGLIYSHYTHNCVAYSSLGTVYNREDVVRETIQRIVELPDRRGMATQVIWRGNDVDGFYTSHLVTGSGRHTEYGMYGKPTGRTFVARTIADCMILENRIYREWLVRDNLALIVQLGLDPHEFALDMATKQFEKGQTIVEIGENRRLIGQYPPESEADVSIAHSDNEVQLLQWLHHIYNKRMFGKIHEIYAPNVQWHGPMMKELFGVAAVLQETMRLVALIPDGAFIPQHICSNPCDEGGEKIAVRWIMDGHHLGYGPLGAPTGHKLFVMGMSHFHIIDGKIVDEWVVYDYLSMLVQMKLGALAMGTDPRA